MTLLLLTSSRYRGLSGRNRYSRAPNKAGTADTAMKILQLWMLRLPRGMLMQLWGMMIQANPPQRSDPTIQKMDWIPR